MPFETVYKVPESFRNKRYLREEDLSVLEEHSLLYFLRKGRCLPLYDYPVMGGFEQRHISSLVEGPFESRPEIGEVNDSKIEKVLELLVPSGEMPVEFEAISYAQYGVLSDRDSLMAVGAFYGHLIVDVDKILEKGEDILSKLRAIGSVERESDDYYKASLDGCVAGLTLQELPDWPVPSFMLEAIGKGDIPQQLLLEMKLNEIKNYIERKYTHDLDVVYLSLSKGLAYNLVLNGESVQKIRSGNNVVL